MNNQLQDKRLPDWVYHAEVLASAFFFALSTLLAKLVQQYDVTAPVITFSRFSIGLVLLLIYMGATRTSILPRNPIVLVLRGVFNLAAVLLFYYAVEFTTITNANLLNLTYPVFVALLSPVFLSERLKGWDWTILVLAGVGIVLVINPRFDQVNVGDLIGVGSGFMGGLAIIMLCFARRSNHTVTVLLFLLGVGTLLSWPGIIGEDFSRYTFRMWMLLIGCAASGVVGQFTLTLAFRNLTAFAGSVTGMSRVIMAAILGYFFLTEIPTWNVVLGSVILFAAIVFLASSEQQGKLPIKLK